MAILESILPAVLRVLVVAAATTGVKVPLKKCPGG